MVNGMGKHQEPAIPYRSTPERERLLRIAAGAVKTQHDHERPMLDDAAVAVSYLMERFAQEDAVIDEFGSLRKFRWTADDEAGATVEVRAVSTQAEAAQKVVREWVATGYHWQGEVTFTRHLTPEDEEAREAARKGQQ